MAQINLMQHQHTDLPASKHMKKTSHVKPWPSSHKNDAYDKQPIPSYHNKESFDSKNVYKNKEKCQKCGDSLHVEGFQHPAKKYQCKTCLPKMYKVGMPLRPIVSSRGSITHGVAKELAQMIKPLVGQSPHHLQNTQHFIQLQGKRLEPGEVTTSFDVKALFTSVPVALSIQTVKQKLQQVSTLPQRTSMSIQQITTLLEFCLTNPASSSRVSIMNRSEVQGSHISPLRANLFMEEFEVKALSICLPPHLPYG